MKNTFYLILICVALFPLSIFSDTKVGPHYIDMVLSECLKNNPSAQGETACLEQAYKSWDKEMDRVYQKLSAKLDEPRRVALSEAQRAWIGYRDLHFAWLTTFYSSLKGNTYGKLAYDRYEFVKSRVDELESMDYYFRQR